MIEWGIGNSANNTNNNQTNSIFYWNYASSNQNEILVTNTALSLILPACDCPRMITLNIAKSSLTSPELADIYFYMNQTFSSLNYTLPTITPNFNFQGKKGLNIIDWQYSGSLHAIGDPANIYGAIITVKTASQVGSLPTSIINNSSSDYYWDWAILPQVININTVPSTILTATNEPRLVSFRVDADPNTKIKIWKNTSVLGNHEQDSYGGQNIINWELSSALKMATVEGSANIIVNTAIKKR